MNHERANWALAGVLGGVILLTAGCSSLGLGGAKPAAWTVTITKKAEASIEVDVIGVTEDEKPLWENYNLDKYWSPGDPRRKRAAEDKITTSFQSGKVFTIEKKDPQWNLWFEKGVTELVVIAFLPGKFEPGSADMRRRFLPLDRKSWDAKKDTLEIDVREDMVKVLTRRKVRR